jgi:hypothetical protein
VHWAPLPREISIRQELFGESGYSCDFLSLARVHGDTVNNNNSEQRDDSTIDIASGTKFGNRMVRSSSQTVDCRVSSTELAVKQFVLQLPVSASLDRAERAASTNLLERGVLFFHPTLCLYKERSFY